EIQRSSDVTFCPADLAERDHGVRVPGRLGEDGTRRIPGQECVVKSLVFVAVCGCILLGGARAGELPQATPKAVGLSAAKLERRKTLVQSAGAKHQPAGAIVLIAGRGRVPYLKTLGRLNARGDKPMPQDAIFRIHSMTKPITTAAALLLYEEGKFK